MPPRDDEMTVAGAGLRRLCVYNAGFWTQPRIRDILRLSGWRVSLGAPGKGDAVGVWGNSPTAWRGRAVAARLGAKLVTVEDAFLRSVLPGRARGGAGVGRIAARGPIGLFIDPMGLHFDPATPSQIELLARSAAARDMEDAAAAALARLRAADLSKYNAHDPELAAPPPGYVLVIDQTRGDASLMGAGRERFLEMLSAARAEHPGATLVLRSHPETSAGLRPGHLTPADLVPGEIWSDAPVSPWRLVENARAVYAVSSQMGFEAMLAGQRPRLFGQPFYAGWGLSDDETPLPRRAGAATVLSLFSAAYLLAPVWYDPCTRRLTNFDGALRQIEAEARAYREDRDGYLAYGMRLWKRPALARFFGNGAGVRFARRPSAAVTLAWAGQADTVPQARRVEDGLLRSRGLGAALTPPLSLVADDLGIYYDPQRESRLEQLIGEPLPPGGAERAQALIGSITAAGVTKYNLGGAVPPLPADGRRRVLVPGQVEDDASIRLGAGAERSNLALLERVRAACPDACLIWKPHPDVEAGLRPGVVSASDAARLADVVASGADAAALIAAADEIWTITSTLGFEALLRGKPVTTLGAPFYAGWGLTRDLGPVPAWRRQARPDLPALVHAALIAYPRYVDPDSALPCPVETALIRLSRPGGVAPTPLRWLAKLQGVLAGQSWIWRR